MTQAAVDPASKPAKASRLEALAEHLRDRSAEAHDPEVLARQFELDPGFVSDVIAALVQTSTESSAPTIREYALQTAAWIRSTARRTSTKFRMLTAEPVKFILATGSFCLVLLWVTTFIPMLRGLLGLVPILFLVCLPLHIMCYFRHGRIRFPMIGSVGFGLGMLPVAIYVTQTQNDGGEAFVNIVLGLAVSVFAGGIYGLIGAGASLLGGYYRIKKEDRRDLRMGRQDLLERLFKVQEKIKDHESSGRGIRRRLGWKDRVRSSPYLPFAAVLVGALYGLIQYSLQGAWRPIPESQFGAVRSLVLTLLDLFAAGGLIFLGYLAGRPGRSILTTLCAYGGFLILGFLTLPAGGDLAKMLNTQQHIPQLLFALITGLMTGIGGMIEDRTNSTKRIREDDPAALVAEMIRIQRRLNRGSRHTCVMVVDVARSTALKAQTDQFDVEYSFRRYHQLVDSIVVKRGGEVVSTAGDGAVAAFVLPQDALLAAKEVQTEMSRFNTDINRLANPFNLRIGLHCGQTDSELNEAPFNELIDIAAHVEAMAPVGGIALTQSMAEALEGERLAETTEIVDGHSVYIALSPVLVG